MFDPPPLLDRQILDAAQKVQACERDLMFVIGSPIGLAPGARELAPFRRGYGELEVDPNTLAYYHLDWAVQDFSSYASQVMLDDISPASRAYAFGIFVGLFSTGDEVEVARRLDPGAGAPPWVGRGRGSGSAVFLASLL